MSTNQNNADLKAMIARMLAAWLGPIPSTLASVVVRGTSYSPAQVAARLQAFHDKLDAPDQLRRALRAAVNAREEAAQTEWRFYDDLSSVVVQHLGDGEALEQFGLPLPKEPARPSSETLAIANSKRQATRKARGIMGRRQREAITTAPQPTLTIHGLPTASQPSAQPVPSSTKPA
jgi:hypothetical protein